MASSPQIATPPSAPTRHWLPKHKLWLVMGLAALFVFITTEIFLIVNYPLYRGYRAQLLHDRVLLFPHALGGTVALLSGPLQFSSRIRQRYRRFHRVLGRIYVAGVFTAAPLALVLAWHGPVFSGTLVQASAWMLCTGAAFVTARNRQIAAHRQWMIRSYAVTFTFIVLRVLNPLPRYFNMTDAHLALTITLVTFAMILGCDLAFNARELTHSRA